VIGKSQKRPFPPTDLSVKITPNQVVKR